ncbi:MAG: 50S ribosomal protein L6 [Planctomycetota bacterium]|jgi:large subunit ribosomal protein L6
MSRIGKIPVAIPQGVTVTNEADVVVVKGPKGELRQQLTGGVQAVVDEGVVRMERPNDEAKSRALHGLYRALVQGMVEGVSKGFEKKLEVVGVSYQAAVEGQRLRLQVGFSHPVFLDIPAGVTVTTPTQTQIVVAGIDKQKVGQFAAAVRRARPPEPYKGKGVRYAGEHIIQKAGKSFVGGEK